MFQCMRAVPGCCELNPAVLESRTHVLHKPPLVMSYDDVTKNTVQKLPLLTVRAGPRDGDEWIKRMKEELMALIAYQRVNKEAGNEWFTIESNKTGTQWTGKVWYVYEMMRYEFDLEFDIPVSYPSAPPELALPELDGKTEKMYRGGKICLDAHFRPLWQRNVPAFGIAHAMALGMGAWLAVEIPSLVAEGRIKPKEAAGEGSSS